jgi:hypothetical protein
LHDTDNREQGVSFKKDSPPSDLFRVKVDNEHGMAQRRGTGMFPHPIMNRFPLPPLEEQDRLNDMPLRENSIECIFNHYRWTEMLKDDPIPGGLVGFRTAHKLTLMPHSIKHYQELGRLVAQAGSLPWEEPITKYGAKFLEGLALLWVQGAST